jgi:hypothetical protein
MSDRLAELDDYISGAMSDGDAAQFEESLFAEPDSDDVRWLDAAAQLAAYVQSRGTYQMGITRAQVDEMMKSGRRIAYLDMGRGGPDAFVRLPRSAEQVIMRYEVDVGDVDRIDTEIEVEGYGLIKTIRDVVFDRNDGALFAYCEASLCEVSLRSRATSRVIGYKGNERRELARIEFRGAVVDG